MSASEIIQVMKAINNHVTNKYSEAVSKYLSEKTNVRILGQRQFFHIMDQTVQKLINDITASLNSKPPTSANRAAVPSALLGQIQNHCNKYNQMKKSLYDNHLSKIRELEKNDINVIQQMMKEKVVRQNILLDNALSVPNAAAQNSVIRTNTVASQNVTQDILSLVSLCQNNQKVQAQNSKNIQNQMVNQAVNGGNPENIQNMLQTLYNMTNKHTKVRPTPTPTSVPNSRMSNNNVDKLNQINPFMSLISQTPNGNRAVTANLQNNQTLLEKVYELTNGNVGTHGQLKQNMFGGMSAQNQNNNGNNNRLPTLGSLPQTIPTLPTLHNIQNMGSVQLATTNLIAPGKNKALLPIQPKHVHTLTMLSNSNNMVKSFDNNPTEALNILPSFPAANVENTISLNGHTNMVNMKTAKVNGSILPNTGTVHGISPKQTIFLTPTAPPKPPPPSGSAECDTSSSDASSVCCDETYECTLCNQYFDSPKQWKSHLQKYHLKTHSKKKKPKKYSKHKTKSKRKRNRNNGSVGTMTNGSRDNTPSHKRRRLKFSCDYCDKEFSRLIAYAKHYNHHMITNKNNVCNFCLTKFKNESDLKKHIELFRAGMLTQDGHYQCCQCIKKFANKTNLQSHINCVHMYHNSGSKSLKMLSLVALRGMHQN